MNFPTKTKIIINSLVILGILIMPFSNFIPKANAQNISGYIAGLTPVISQMPGCKAAIGSGIKSLFGKNNTDLASTQNFINKVAPGLLSTEVEKAAAESVSIQVNDPVLSGILDMQTLELKSINKSTSATDKNANCLNAIGKAIVKNLIQRMTLSIVNWIQTGNQGNPFFAENISKYFGDIAKTEILGFGLEISDPNKFPFGKAFMQNMARSYNNKFADNATYSLNQMIQATNPEYSAATFSADFSKGGWGAWQAMTQVPANNPLGFQLMASNELGKRLEGTTQSAAQMAQTALDWGNGITGDQRCTDPWNQTKEASDAALKAGDTANVCKNWEYVTPGSVVGHMLTKSMDDSSNSLLSAETLNDAIAAIMDAAIARLSNEMMGTGLANASTDEDTYNNQYSPFSGTSQIEKDFSSYQIAASTWLSQNPSFNIRTDLNQALIDEQRTYVDKLNESATALGDLIKWIRQLDYCIPGPNPDWEETASNAISGFSDPSLKKQWWNSAVATGLSSYAGAVGTLAGPIGGIAGAVAGGIFDMISNPATASYASKIYASYISNVLGVEIDSGQDQVRDPGSLTGLFNNILTSYSKVIEKVFFTPGANDNGVSYMPPVTLEARAEFKKIDGYEQMIAAYSPKMIAMKGVITRLEAIKTQVDTLNGQLASGALDQTNYEQNLAQYIISFAEISSNLVSGDDIAAQDDILKQAQNEKTYVKSNLLEGPLGCETFMSNLSINNHSTYKKYAGRQGYPFEIYHNYGPVESTTSGTYNYQWNPTVGVNEGFLFGSIYFNNWSGFGSSATPNSNSCDNRYISDVVLTSTNSKGSPVEDIGFGGNSTNNCGVVLYFERNFSIY